MKKIRSFFIGVKSEMRKVKFPNRKNMMKYSTATVVIIIFLAVFFRLTDFVLAYVTSLLG